MLAATNRVPAAALSRGRSVEPPLEPSPNGGMEVGKDVRGREEHVMTYGEIGPLTTGEPAAVVIPHGIPPSPG